MSEPLYVDMRKAMVANQLRTTGVNDPEVLAAFGAVPREWFVPAERRALAYSDAMVPLGGGRKLNSPMALGRLLTEADPRPADHVLLVGAATGYAAALLARLAGSVVALEEDAALVAQARESLAGTTVSVVEGPLTEGHAAAAPYDLIVIDGAIEYVPQPLVQQLAPTGRLVTALLDQGVSRISIGRRGGEGFGVASVADVASTILPGFAKPRAFSF